MCVARLLLGLEGDAVLSIERSERIGVATDSEQLTLHGQRDIRCAGLGQLTLPTTRDSQCLHRLLIGGITPGHSGEHRGQAIE